MKLDTFKTVVELEDSIEQAFAILKRDHGFTVTAVKEVHTSAFTYDEVKKLKLILGT